MAALAAEAGVSGWTEASVAAFCAPPLGRAWVAEAGQGLQGFLLGRVVADEAELLLVAVAPEARRQGLARALCARFARDLEATVASALHLEVAVDNAPAIALYRSLGFTEVGLRRNYYPSGADALLMRRRVR